MMHNVTDDCQFLDNHLLLSRKSKVKSALRRYHPEEVIPANLGGLPQKDNIFETRDHTFRSNSVCSVVRYNDVTLTPNNVTQKYGKQTKSSILRSISRSDTAKTICCKDSWINNKQRLCKVYYYYNWPEKVCVDPRDRISSQGKHGILTGGRYSSPDVIDSLQVVGGGICVSRENLGNVYEISPHRAHVTRKSEGDIAEGRKRLSEKITKASMPERPKSSIGVNTDNHFLSIKKWHGADWQVNRPKHYGPPVKMYDPNISVPVRSKKVTTAYVNVSASALKTIGVT